MLLQSYVEDNGNLSLVADPNTLRKDILQLDLHAAHHRTQLTALMKKQVGYDHPVTCSSCNDLQTLLKPH